MIWKKIILFFIIFVSIQTVFSLNECTSIADEYIVKCNIPESYFIQSFTCLNKDCSDKLEKNENFLDLYIDNKKTSVIFQNYINIHDLKNNLGILNNICIEKFDEEALIVLENKLEIYDKNKWEFVSGSKYSITPYNEDNFNKQISNYNQKEKYLEQCFNSKPEKIKNWVITSKTKKTYCETTYDDENKCFSTEVNNTKFILFLILNPSWNSFLYIFYFLFATLVIILILDTIFHLFKNKKMKEFIKIDKDKTLWFSIFSIPTLYVYGSIIGYLANKRFYWYINEFSLIILITVGMISLYFIVCLVFYFKKEKLIEKVKHLKD